MEMVGLVLIIVVVCAYYGLFEVVEVGARMGSRQIKDLERDQKAKLMNKASARTIREEDYKLAASNNALIDAYDL